MPHTSFNAAASPILDWWMIDEVAVRQFPFRAVGDALTRFAQGELEREDTKLSSLFYNIGRVAHQLEEGREDNHSPAVQLSMIVSGINHVTDFSRRMVQGQLPTYAEMSPSQSDLSRDPPVMFRQTVAALDCLAQELQVIRKFLDRDAPQPPQGPQELRGIRGDRQASGEQKSTAPLRLVR